jgi:ankyrin repeat protein
MAEMTFPSADKERRSESEYAVSSKENEHLKIIYKKLLGACEDGKVEIVRALLQTGCNANGISEEKEIHVSKTPLMHAATRGHCDIVDCLLEFKAKVDLVESSTGRTALHYASAGGHLKVVEILLNGKGNIQKGDRYLSTPLKLAFS